MNFAASMETFGCTFVNSIVDNPPVQIITHLKGILTPETSR